MTTTPPCPLPCALRVLVVVADEGERVAVRRALRRRGADPEAGIEVEVMDAVDLQTARVVMGGRELDCVLVDYRLPDGTALALLDDLAQPPQRWLPIVILTGPEDEQRARAAVGQGAQDCVRKAEVDGPALWRAIRHAIERVRIAELEQRLLHARREVERVSLPDVARAAGELVRAEIRPRASLELRLDPVSEIAAGTVATGRLPNDTARAGAASRWRPPVEPGWQRARILIIDDEPELLRAYQRLLAPYHDVVVADSGTRGMEVLSGDDRFDVILCDLTMPGMDGVSVYQYLAQERAHLCARLLFWSGGAFTKRARTFLARHGRTCLDKPVSRATLLDAVQRIVRNQA